MLQQHLLYCMCGLLALIPSYGHAETVEECVLKNMKGVNDRYVATMIQEACEEKAIPRKCRGLSNAAPGRGNLLDDPKDFIYGNDNTPADKDSPKQRCIKECKKASYWSRKLGECSTN